MDERLDQIQNYLLLLFLSFWHKLTKAWEKSYSLSRAWQAVRDSQKEDQFVFLDPNSTPLRVKGSVENKGFEGMLIYNSESNQFLSCDRLQPRDPCRFDVVHVNCVRGNELSSIDMTSFFHTVQWKQGSAPSLVEMVTLYGFCHSDLRPWSQREISGWSLVVLDSDADEHTIPLTSKLATSRFTGAWSLVRGST